MKIVSLDALPGFSYWMPNKKKIISLKLDLEDLENIRIHANFVKNLKKLFPNLKVSSLADSDQVNLAQVIGLLAAELQNLAKMSTRFEKKFQSQKKGVYRIFFSYEFEEAGFYAAKRAIKIVDCLAKGRKYLQLKADLKHLTAINEREQLGPSTRSIIKQAEKRGIPWCQIQGQPLITLGQGIYQEKIWMTVSSKTSSIGVETASNKDLTKKILNAHFIPTPKGYIVSTLKELRQKIDVIAFPITIKPLDGNQGKGVSCNITNKENAEQGFKLAKKFSEKVIVEQFIRGKDYRFLVINFKLVAAARRSPAQIVGNGSKTIAELIHDKNLDPNRGFGHDSFLTKIKVDAITKSILKEKKLQLTSILPKGKVLMLKHSANISSGGTAEEVISEVHPFNKKLAERVAKIINLDICGIDAVIQDISKPMDDSNSSVLEVNAAPGLRMHLGPSKGESKNVAIPILESLYPPGRNSKIPIVAVTGTNGKTTVVRLIAHLAQQSKLTVGFTTTEGVYIDNDLIFKGDCSGYNSGRTVLLDPNVEFAILECARGGMLLSGLAFEHCDISIITNITEDHLGLEDIHTFEELIEVKALIAHKTKKNGFVILNADDESVYGLKDKLESNVALFALKKTDRIKKHCQAGGLAAYTRSGWLIVCNEKEERKVAQLKDIPLTFNDTAVLMTKNILPATLAAIISGFSMNNVKKGLLNFLPSAEQTPGRMNLYQFKDFQLMLDYVHNQGGYTEIKKYLDTLDCSKKIGIISAVGDRRAQDIKKLGILSARMFDEIIIKHNKDGRGRSNKALSDLLLEGIHTENLTHKVKIISDEYEALDYAIRQVIPGTFIFYAVDDVFLALNNVNTHIRRWNQ